MTNWVPKKIFFLLTFGGVLFVNIFADTNSGRPQIIPPYSPQYYDQQIARIYQTVLNNSNEDINARLDKSSKYFLGRPYFFGPLGEGANGQFDQNPLYRTDKFDCETLVDTTLALAKANNLNEFKNIINQIRYKNGEVAYVNRNHFTSVDWNSNNEKAGYIKDVTTQLGFPVKISRALMNKPNWYHLKQANSLKLLQQVSLQEQNNLVQHLRDQGKQVKALTSRIPYIPFSELYSQQGSQLIPNEKIFNAIPSPAIIEIVCANCYHPSLGTTLDVTHMGLAIRTKHGLMFREASEIKGKVIDISLADYLKRDYTRMDPAQAGINIHIIA